MQRLNLKKKGLIFAVIFIIFNINFIQSHSGNFVKKTLIKYPENSIICGFTTDYVTGEPIVDTYIDFFIEDPQGNDYDYTVWSDENGFYIIENATAGYCYEYGAWADGYHFYWSGDFEIGENQTVWVNMSMFPLQPETATICGYITDEYTGKPVYNVTVISHWVDIWHHINYNGTETDENGFFSINVGEGRCGIYTEDEAYIPNGSVMYYTENNEIIWVNLSLTPELIVEIIKPDSGIFYNNKKILSFYFPIIIGPIDIQIRITLNDGAPIDHVRILIDGEEKSNSSTWPYNYHWDEKKPFRFRHKIEVTASRKWDSDTTEKLEVWKFL